MFTFLSPRYQVLAHPLRFSWAESRYAALGKVETPSGPGTVLLRGSCSLGLWGSVRQGPAARLHGVLPCVPERRAAGVWAQGWAVPPPPDLKVQRAGGSPF